MIIRPRPSALSLLFILRGSILPTVAPRLLVVIAASACIALVNHAAPQVFASFGSAPFTLIGLALSIFLGFRNNTCYERWWEGRRQWGQLVAETRSFVRDLLAMLPENESSGRRCALRTVAFAHALRDQLRETKTESAHDWLPSEEREFVDRHRSQPDAVLLVLSGDLRLLLRNGQLTDVLFGLLSTRLQAMTTVQTACERLRSAPMPFTYTLLLHRTAWLFCLLSPLGLVSSLGAATPVATIILAYAFFGLDALGDELEEPFGLRQNCLPLDAMVRAIEIAVLDTLGDADVPQPLQPRGFVLT